VGAVAHGIRIPKTESPDDVRWVAERAPGKPIICAIESARGVLAAYDIARVPGVRHLAMGGVDLQRDLHAGNGNLQTLYVRSQLVIASRAAGIERPIDSVYPQLDDETGLLEQAQFALSLGFFGKSAIHPRQLTVLHEVFTPSATKRSPGRRKWPLRSILPEVPPYDCRAASSSTYPSLTEPNESWNWPQASASHEANAIDPPSRSFVEREGMAKNCK
jgi:HpcH/HpaI aldolase/citrate lyase family